VEDNVIAIAPQRQLTSTYKATFLALLTLCSLFGWVDRTIIATIGQAIKVELKLSDLQLGLLHGFAFSILYVTFSLPAARLSERFNRITIISASVALWSLFTSLSGLGHTFVQLLLCRIGVGIGEASANPPAYSLIIDYFSPRRRPMALSIYQLGVSLGTMAGAIIGGFITQHFGWRAAFLVLGIPGIVLAIFFRIIAREIPRGHSDVLSGRPVNAGAPPSILATARCLLSIRSARHMIAGIIIFTFVNFGAGTFVAPFFLRAYGLNYTQVGLIIGLAVGCSNAVGTITGGILAGILSRRSTKAYALIPAFCFAVACPLYFFSYLQADWRIAVALMTLAGLIQYLYFSPCFASIYNLVDARMRATTTALVALVAILVALVIGTVVVGGLIDLLAQHYFRAIATGYFAAKCPGGVAPLGSQQAIAAACHAAIDHATRVGLVICSLCLGWAALHFFMAAQTIKRDLAAAQGGQCL
jgi:MFS family permease